jgi:hypothetical protein
MSFKRFDVTAEMQNLRYTPPKAPKAPKAEDKNSHFSRFRWGDPTDLQNSRLSEGKIPSESTACSFCGTSEGTWVLNRGTCWEKVVCGQCQGKVTMPTAHLCDPSLPLAMPCKEHQQRPPWLCSVCSTR